MLTVSGRSQPSETPRPSLPHHPGTNGLGSAARCGAMACELVIPGGTRPIQVVGGQTLITVKPKCAPCRRGSTLAPKAPPCPERQQPDAKIAGVARDGAHVAGVLQRSSTTVARRGSNAGALRQTELGAQQRRGLQPAERRKLRRHDQGLGGTFGQSEQLRARSAKPSVSTTRLGVQPAAAPRRWSFDPQAAKLAICRQPRASAHEARVVTQELTNGGSLLRLSARAQS